MPHTDDSLSSGGEQPAGVAGGLRADSLLGGVLILLVLSAVQRAAGFVRAVLFCRWLDPEQLGQWDMAFAFFMLAAPLAVLSLPGTFGRYVEYYRQRGQFRPFLRRTALCCAVLSALGVTLMCLTRRWFSHLIFGTSERPELAVLLGVSLLAVIAYNYLISLFTALRNMRLASGMELANSLAFAVLGIGLLLGWECSAGSVVMAYGGACLLCCLGSLWWLRRAWRACPEPAAPPAAAAVWAKLLPFAAWVLLSNLLTNLFAVADRYLIVHCARGTSADALALVGHYHSSRVVPLLLASIAAMLAAMILPHLSHDWEAGRREQVSARLNLFLKLLVLALTAVSAAVLLLAPLLFNVALRGKYADGLAVLPWTLVYCIWLGAAMIAQQYLWCAERASLVNVALAAGLLVGVAMNLVLLPRLGLRGAVLATSAANLATLVLILWFSRRRGFRVDRGLLIVLAAPLSLCLGPWVALLLLAAVALEGLNSDRILSHAEKRRLAAGWGQYVKRGKRLRLVQLVLGGPS